MEPINKWMERALELAEEELKIGEVPVGCVFVYEDQAIAESRNSVNKTRNATRHAEMNCVDDVLKWCEAKGYDPSDVFSNTQVVVTVEPCIMCAMALHYLNISHVTFGCNNDRFGGFGSVLETADLISKPCSRTSGIESEKAMQLLKDFYKGTNPNAPVPNVRSGLKATQK